MCMAGDRDRKECRCGVQAGMRRGAGIIIFSSLPAMARLFRFHASA